MPAETIEPRFEWSMAFLAIMESGSFTRAAEALGCSKASVSKQLAQLEQALGAKLLHRTTRTLVTTESGAVYLAYCKRLRDTLNDAERTVHSLRTEARGRIRMTAPTTFGIAFLTQALQALHDKHPEIEVDLDLSTAPRDLVAEGYDLALRLSPAPDPRLIAKPLWASHDWIVAAPSVLDSAGPPARPSDLETRPCLCNTHFPSDDLWLFTRDAEIEVARVKHWLRMNNYPLMRQAALAGMGIAKLPAYLVADDVAAGRLQRLFADHALQPTPLYLVFTDQRPLPHKVRVAVDHLVAWFTRDARHWGGPPSPGA